MNTTSRKIWYVSFVNFNDFYKADRFVFVDWNFELYAWNPVLNLVFLILYKVKPKLFQQESFLIQVRILIISILSPYIRSCNQNQNLFMLQEFCRHFKVLLGHFMFMLVSILLSIKAELVLASTSFAILFVLFTSLFVLLMLNWQNLQNSQSKSSLI